MVAKIAIAGGTSEALLKILGAKNELRHLYYSDRRPGLTVCPLIHELN